MDHLVEEFWHLSGVGPSLLEKTSADPMLGILAKAFSVKALKPADVKYLLYRKVGHGVELEDRAEKFGGILTSVEAKEADPKALLAFLKKHGAKAAPKVEESKGPFVTGDKRLDSAVRWLLDKSKKRTLSDGTIDYFFQGKLPSRMVDAFWEAKKAGVLQTRDAGSEVSLSWEGPLGTFSLLHGAYKSTRNKVRFKAGDYTVPAGA